MTKTLSFLAMLVLALAGWIILTSTQSTEAFWQWWDWEKCWWHEDIKNAIEANDYWLLPTETQEKIDQEKFNSLVQKHWEKEAMKAELETIVQSNDFEAFKAFAQNKKAQKQNQMEEKIAEKLANATEEEKVKIQERVSKMEEKKAERLEPTEAELQEKFTSLVTNYNETGELYTWMRKGKKGFKWAKGMRWGKKGFKWSKSLRKWWYSNKILEN